MAKDLTNSKIDRQNILNNDLAIVEVQKELNLSGFLFEGGLYLTKEMVAQLFGVDIRTIERYTSDFYSELKNSGYEVLSGKKLKDFISNATLYHPDIAVGMIDKKTARLSVYTFRAFLNIGMLISESESAKLLRQKILDIVMDLINQKTGGATKYINQRDIDFAITFVQDENYHKMFTDALRDYTDMDNSKYSLYTNKIYTSIFREDAKEYRRILSLDEKDNVRKTLYSEILKIIHSYECGLAEEIKLKSEQLGKKLNYYQTQEVFDRFESRALWKPLVLDARIKMASRDLALREAFHISLKDYIQPLEKEEFERFLGADSDIVKKLMDENQEVFKRLKERQ